MKKISAFTLVELTVALLISAIVMTLSYYTFLFFSRQYNQYRLKSALVTELYLFEQAFQTDLEKADLVKDSAGVMVKMKIDGEEVRYQWDREGVRRLDNDQTDLFSLGKCNATFIKLNDTASMVQGIFFNFTPGNTTVSAAFTKYYSSRELIMTENSSYE